MKKTSLNNQQIQKGTNYISSYFFLFLVVKIGLFGILKHLNNYRKIGSNYKKETM